jgi:hypothetical protein
MRRSALGTVILCAVLLTIGARVRAQLFGPPQCWPIDSRPAQMVIADADGDGLNDILATADPAGTFYVATTSASGPPVLANVEAFTHGAGPFAIGDIEQDGDFDVAAASSTTLTILRRSGSAYQRTDVTLLPFAFGVTTVRMRTHIVDIEGDGDTDIVVGGRQVLLNDGAGNLAAPVLLALPSGSVWSASSSQLDAADVDGDGDQDLIAFAYTSPPGPGSGASVLIHDGALGFTHGSTLPSASGFFMVGNKDGDMDVDLVLGVMHGVQLYVNDGTGTFTATGAALMTAIIAPPYGANLGDTDSDGDFELLIARPGPVTDIYDGGPAGFVLASSLPYVGTLAVGDLNGDNLNDIVTTSHPGAANVCFVPGLGPLVNLITKTGGDLQSTNSNSSFAAPLQVRVTTLSGGTPVAGAPVTFTRSSPGEPVVLQTVTTDANGDAAISVTTLSGGGPMAVRAEAPNAEPVEFALFVRSYRLHYVPIIGFLTVSLTTDLPSTPLVVAFDQPLPAPGYVSSPAGDLYTSILTPAPTLFLLDGIGLFGPPQPSVMTSTTGHYSRVFQGLAALNGTGFMLVSQAYALAPGEIFVSNPAFVTF